MLDFIWDLVPRFHIDFPCIFLVLMQRNVVFYSLFVGVYSITAIRRYGIVLFFSHNQCFSSLKGALRIGFLLKHSSSESSFIVDHWQCPLVVFLKVNMDIVTSMYNMCTDVGLIARNHMGCFVVARFFFSHEFFFSKSFRSDGHYGGTYLIKSCGLNSFDRVQCNECGGCSLVYLIPLYNSLMVLF